MFKRRKPEDLPGLPQTPAGVDEAVLEGGLASPVSTSFPAVPPPAPGTRPDAGAGASPYRSAPKEAPAMGRSPFAAPPAPPSSQPAPGMSSSPASSPTPAIPPRPGAPPSRGREPAERRTLVVGRGISVQGTVTDAERLVVEGTVEASMIHATELAIAQGGVFKGEVEVEDTEIAGTIDGTLTARGNLVVRATGKVLGTARCRRLQVEDGGQITGRIEMITEPARTEIPRPTETSPI